MKSAALIAKKTAKSTKSRQVSKHKFPLVIPFPTSGSELKFYTEFLSSSFTSISSGGVIVSITDLIVLGTDVDERIGRSIHLKDVRIVGTLVGGQSGTIADDPYNTVRICVIDSNGPASSFAPFAVDDEISPVTSTQNGHTYFDKRLTLVSPGFDGSSGYEPAVFDCEYVIKVNKTYSYSGFGAPSGIELMLLMVSDSVGVPNPGFGNGKLIVTYYDA